MKNLRSPIGYFGGKGNMTKKIVPVLERIPHKRYCEVFGGGASILLAKIPVEVEVYNDIDEAVVGFFKVLADPKLFERFYRRVALLPYSRSLYYEARKRWKNEIDIVEQAVWWFVVARQSFGGRFGSGWGFDARKTTRRMAETCRKWLTCIKMLPEIHRRLQRVQIECLDFRKCIETYDTEETLFYLDPPYLPETRKGGGYGHEMTTEDHEKLIELLLNVKGKCALSGYPNELYNRLIQAGWRYYEWETVCHAVGRTRYTKILGEGSATEKQSRTECLWVKGEVQALLFDGGKKR